MHHVLFKPKTKLSVLKLFEKKVHYQRSCWSILDLLGFGWEILIPILGKTGPKNNPLLGKTWDLEIPLLGIKWEVLIPVLGKNWHKNKPFLGKTWDLEIPLMRIEWEVSIPMLGKN